ncbi:MAG TPA: molybdopterin cofactor-binding domain-containing protein, partial [Woeseiaceae bacterium]|nr:molybdopterin cofactor-binding domain-containing protein [Woeseiaceae bacterium]
MEGVQDQLCRDKRRAMVDPVSRRDFVKLTAVSSLGLVLGLPTPGRARARSRYTTALHPLIRISTDGEITLFARNPEMGQGVKTSLPMMIAEELDVDWRAIRVEQSDWDRTLENQFSGGSLSVRLSYAGMRLAGASTREMLVRAAADRWRVSAHGLKTAAGRVFDPATGASLAYGELAEAAAALPVPTDPAQKSRADFTLIGRSVPDVDLTRIVTGAETYSLDLTLPDMLYAAVQRCPVSDGQPISFDSAGAERISGVLGFRMLRNADCGGRVILPNNPNFVSGVAALAENTWAAIEAAKGLKVRWDLPEVLDDSAALMRRYEEAIEQPGEIVREDGDADAALRDAAVTIDVIYKLPFLAHVTMEPMNCTADVRPERTVIWAPT